MEYNKILVSALLCFSAFSAQAEIAESSKTEAEQSIEQQLEAQDQELRQVLKESEQVVEVSDPSKAITESIPDEILNQNEHYFTISSENDFYAAGGEDKDYTNGVLFTYMDMGADQPFFVKWLDGLSPFFKVNKTTTSYYSFGQNIYTPQDITTTELNSDDRPYAAFTYISGGVSTATGNHVDNMELTLGWVGPSALGKQVQTEYHKIIDADKPMGWDHQLKDEPGIVISLERQWPRYMALRLKNEHKISFVPHVGASVGNVYTYANAGFTLSYMPDDKSFQSQPIRVRPAMPGSGFFLSGKNNWSWMTYIGIDTRLVAHNIFLDGNTWKDSHSVDKRLIVLDATAGVAVNYENFRIGYALNWRSQEFDSPLAENQIFGSITMTYRY